MEPSVIVFDQCTYFVEADYYELGEDEEIVFRGTFDECEDKMDEFSPYPYGR